MHGFSAQSLGVEKEKEKAKSSERKKAGASLSSGVSLQRGDDNGREANEDGMFWSGFRYYNDKSPISPVTDSNISPNPWTSSVTGSASTSAVTLRSRHIGQSSSRDFGFFYDEGKPHTSTNNAKRELETETRRRRRRSRSLASLSKHPLFDDADVDIDAYGHAERHFDRTDSEVQSFGSQRGLSSPFDHRTRPSLRRAIGSLEGRTDDETDRSTKGTERSDDSDVDVIVHKITRTDTLAGIALKYNIPLAQLRKANKLWTNDSIHLRPVLYIPLRDVAKLLPGFEESSQPDSVGHTQAEAETAASPNPRDVKDYTRTRNEIRKIPHSQLSFFPSSGAGAPSSSSTSVSMSTSRRPIPDTQRIYSSPSTNFSPPPAFSLASLFQGLNNATQEIKSRLSLDSLHSSRHSSDPGDDGEIELNAVKRDKTTKLAGIGEDDNGASSRFAFVPNTPTVSSDRNNRQQVTRHAVLNPSFPSPSLPSPSTPQKTIIRSVQLQPSPEMKIPTATTATPLNPRNDSKNVI